MPNALLSTSIQRDRVKITDTLELLKSLFDDSNNENLRGIHTNLTETKDQFLSLDTLDRIKAHPLPLPFPAITADQETPFIPPSYVSIGEQTSELAQARGQLEDENRASEESATTAHPADASLQLNTAAPRTISARQAFSISPTAFESPTANVSDESVLREIRLTIFHYLQSQEIVTGNDLTKTERRIQNHRDLALSGLYFFIQYTLHSGKQQANFTHNLSKALRFLKGLITNDSINTEDKRTEFEKLTLRVATKIVEVLKNNKLFCSTANELYANIQSELDSFTLATIRYESSMDLIATAQAHLDNFYNATVTDLLSIGFFGRIDTSAAQHLHALLGKRRYHANAAGLAMALYDAHCPDYLLTAIFDPNEPTVGGDTSGERWKFITSQVDTMGQSWQDMVNHHQSDILASQLENNFFKRCELQRFEFLMTVLNDTTISEFIEKITQAIRSFDSELAQTANDLTQAEYPTTPNTGEFILTIKKILETYLTEAIRKARVHLPLFMEGSTPAATHFGNTPSSDVMLELKTSFFDIFFNLSKIRFFQLILSELRAVIPVAGTKETVRYIQLTHTVLDGLKLAVSEIDKRKKEVIYGLAEKLSAPSRHGNNQPTLELRRALIRKMGDVFTSQQTTLLLKSLYHLSAKFSVRAIEDQLRTASQSFLFLAAMQAVCNDQEAIPLQQIQQILAIRQQANELHQIDTNLILQQYFSKMSFYKGTQGEVPLLFAEVPLEKLKGTNEALKAQIEQAYNESVKHNFPTPQGRIFYFIGRLIKAIISPNLPHLERQKLISTMIFMKQNSSIVPYSTHQGIESLLLSWLSKADTEKTLGGLINFLLCQNVLTESNLDSILSFIQQENASFLSLTNEPKFLEKPSCSVKIEEIDVDPEIEALQSTLEQRLRENLDEELVDLANLAIIDLFECNRITRSDLIRVLTLLEPLAKKKSSQNQSSASVAADQSIIDRDSFITAIRAWEAQINNPGETSAALFIRHLIEVLGRSTEVESLEPLMHTVATLIADSSLSQCPAAYQLEQQNLVLDEYCEGDSISVSATTFSQSMMKNPSSGTSYSSPPGGNDPR